MMTIILLPRVAHDPGQVLAIAVRIGMLRPKYFFTDTKCALAKGPRLCIATLGKGEFGQIVESFGSSGMLRSKRFLKNSEGPLPQHLGPLKVSLFISKPCQQIEVLGNDGISRFQDSFTSSQCLRQKLLGLLILALFYIELRQIGEGNQGVGMF